MPSGKLRQGATRLFEAPLPVPAEPLPGESGYGFCLRLAAVNSMSLAELLALVDIKRLGQIGASESKALAFLGGAPSESLQGRFPVNLAKSVGLNGHVLPLRSMLRWRRPQICPCCIAVNGWCRLNWEFSLSVVCLEHRCLLIDECPTCGKQLSWTRPGVEWGVCKHFLGMHPSAMKLAPDDLLLFGQQVSALVDQTLQADSLAGMPLKLPLSLGGCFIWAYAFGVSKRQMGSVERGAYRSIMRTNDAIDLLQRALDRWKKFTADAVDDLPHLRLVVAEFALLNMITSPEPLDRDIGMDIYRALYGERALNSLIRSHGVVRQLTLFS